MPVNCGNRARHADGAAVTHASVDAVRACYLAGETWACDWLVPLVNPEDGEVSVAVECGGLSWHLPDGRGYTCEYGHDHVYAEVRQKEGWDYVVDPEEAGLLAGRGVVPVAMNGGPIDIDPSAFR